MLWKIRNVAADVSVALFGLARSFSFDRGTHNLASSSADTLNRPSNHATSVPLSSRKLQWDKTPLLPVEAGACKRCQSAPRQTCGDPSTLTDLLNFAFNLDKAMSSSTPSREVLNPINPSLLPRLDPAFVDLYNEHIGNVPTGTADLSVLRRGYSNYCSFAKTTPPEVGKIWNSTVPGYGNYVKIAVRVYESLTFGLWPVYLNFYGGG